MLSALTQKHSSRYKPSVNDPAKPLRFPWLWLLATLPAAGLWTMFILRNNNLEMQAIDLAHHVMFVAHLQTPWGEADPQFVGLYPVTSHRVATAWLPVFHDPVQAIRAASIVTLLVMLVAQWYLLRSQLPASIAMLLMFAWQVLCTHCKLGDVNHYMWDFQYNYSRAVSAAALWVMILAFVVPPFQNRVFSFFFCLGLATFAFRCHIAAGALALGTLGVWCVVKLIKRDWIIGGGGLVALALTSAALLAFTDEWRYLASLSADNGPMPIRNVVLYRWSVQPDVRTDKHGMTDPEQFLGLIDLWIPTAIGGLLFALKRAVTGIPLDLATAVLCGLIPAAVLQGYMLYGKNVTHTVGTYPYNQMLFYTFELSTLFWIVILSPLLKLLPSTILSRVLAVAVTGWGLYAMLETDMKRKKFSDDRDVMAVIRELREHREDFAGHYYYDPDQEIGSYLVTRVVQGPAALKTAEYRLHVHLRQPKKLLAEPGLKGLFMPGDVDATAIFGDRITPAMSHVGSFQRIDFKALPAESK
ncbi:hypothetical protein BH11PLA2_BH11PLA2_37260 [soil metagenome]